MYEEEQRFGTAITTSLALLSAQAFLFFLFFFPCLPSEHFHVTTRTHVVLLVDIFVCIRPECKRVCVCVSSHVCSINTPLKHTGLE